ncbi:hypothetical protein SELMODRAFT_413648 [Selaginella moellendorffii]|uniref:Bifunctional inhibitor/plant lipid transfer protein/seed storage helical domain-containing protein n=1 Tax=Selaginella moellendorffii TaxID=88036 RepID=D8RPS1_SELML|nr:hypothetical protein SELMODRAFT_413648 [Selaginella moellendorffii]
MDSKALQLLILSLVSIGHFPNCGTSQCDRAHLLKECVPCVASGTVLEHPDVNCCKAVNALGHNCLCSLIVSSTGVLAKTTMKRYVESCQVVPPEDYQCEGIIVGLLVQYGSTTVGNGNFVSLSSTGSAPTVDIEGFGKNGTTRLFSVVMADQKALVASNKVYPYINFWIANIPAGSTGAVKGSILEPYVSPSNTSKNIPYPNPFNARNHTYDFVLVPQRNPLVKPMDSRLVNSLADIVQQYHCGSPLQTVSFTTSLH